MAKRTFPALFLAIAMIASLLPGLSLAETARITDKDVTLTLVRSDNSNQPMKTDSLVLDELYKRTGVKLSVEAIPGSDFATKTKTLIATNSMPDILYDTYDVADFAGTGVFLPISEYLDVMPNLSALFEAQPDLKKLYIEGVLYTIPVLGRNVYRMGRSPMIREDLLAETGLPMPTTFDELTEVLRAIKANHPDIYPVANRNGTTNLFTCYAYAMGLGSGVYWEPAQNAYVYAQMQPGFADILKVFADWYQEGILDPDYAVSSGSQWQEKLASGRSSFFFDNPSFAANFNKALAVDNAAQAFVPMEIPAYGDTQRGLYYMKNDLGATTLSADTKDPELACKFMDYLYSDEGCDLTNWGLEGVQYTREGDAYALIPSAIEQYRSTADPLRAFYGDIGAGKLGLARYIDERAQDAFFDEQMKAWYATWETWSFMGEMVIDPPFTAEENEELVTLRTKVNTALETEYDKFIMGQAPIEDWSRVVTSIEQDASRIAEIYNAANARVQ
ncbi:MAG TPA: extracellular solute-binding protein [Clostridia bacterium]|nr:extracellular solute-binding protein [Clostridia bacterium]